MNASDTLNKRTDFKRRQRDFVRWLIMQDELLGQKVRGCASFLHLREWLNHNESCLINANFCKKHLLCPACASRRAVKSIARYTPKLEHLIKESPNLIPCMITFGPRNGSDFGERLALLKDIIKKMGAAARKGESTSGRHDVIEWNKVAGSLRAIEVTNKGNGWHVHTHIFALLRDYVNRERLSEELMRFSGGECSIVDVRKCKNGIIAGMCEVVKYAVKPGELTNEQTLHVYNAAKGARLMDPTGILRGVLVGDIDQDDLPKLDGPTRDLIACWLWGDQRYHIRELPQEEVLNRAEEARLSCQLLVSYNR